MTAALSPARPRTTLTRAGRMGTAISLGALVVLCLWASFTMISGAVIAQGEASVRGQPRTVQHLDGGILSEILVANGDAVTAGQVIARLDPTLLTANLDIARSRLAGSLALAARLDVETAGGDRLDPAQVAALPGAELADPQDLARQIDAQAAILVTRRDLHAGEAAQLQENLARLDAQALGIQALIDARGDQLALVEKELANLEPLSAKGLIRDTQLLDAQRRQSELKGQLASDRADLGRIAVERRDAELKLAQSRHQEAEKVATDLRAARAEVQELVPQILTTQAQLDRVDIRAPADGIVHEMQLTTTGGVLAAGQTLAQVVPVADGVEFDLRLEPRSIDEVHPGQTARIVLPAFDSHTTPQIFGEVASISPTSVTDPQTGRSFYRLRLTVPAAELDRLGARNLVPGMPVEAYLQTGDRSVMAYLLHPLAVQFDRMFREG